MSTRTSVVTARRLRKSFSWTPVLDDVTFQAGPGETVGVFGPNGSGKTTLLRVFATLLRPNAGLLTLFGGNPDSEDARHRIGFLGHDSFLYPDLTAEENLRFYGKAYRVSPLADRIAAQLQHVGLDRWQHTPVRHFSRGMEQRLALARTLLHDPDLILLDEPHTGLDTAAQDVLHDALGRAAARGKTVMLSSHDFERCRDLCTRVVLLHRGRLAWESTGTLPTVARFAEIYAESTR